MVFKKRLISIVFGIIIAISAKPELIAAQESVVLQAPKEDTSTDTHNNYYYPAPLTIEHYASRVSSLEDSDKIRRLGFVIGMARQLISDAYAPDYALFAKGDQAQKLIITGLRDGSLDTIYRARALFASLTLVARSTPFFQDNTQPEEATFFDLLKLLGFTQVTISDGKKFSHQVIID